MEQGIEKLKFGAPDLKKQIAEIENRIRKEVNSEFTEMSEDAREAIIQSRLKVTQIHERPVLEKSDFGNDTSDSVKEDLFE